MASGVVEVAGDPGALLGDGQQPLAFGVSLGASGAFFEVVYLFSS